MTGGSETGNAGELTGTLTSVVLPPGEIYPGTPHDCLLYLPPGLDPGQPLPFTIFFDGIWVFAERMGTPAMLDRLIAEGDVPPMAGIFLDPGVLAVASTAMQGRVNRHLEYDAITDRFSRFLIEELIPFMEQHHPLAADPNERALAGLSSSAVAAMMAAWHRPDQFRRIFTSIGTFVDIAGGHALPYWIRKCEPKPLRVFMQETIGDFDIVYGNWPLANETMASALAFSGYDHQLAIGPGGHDMEHAAEILPDALRWLWRDYPQPIAAPRNSPIFETLLYPDHPWEMVAEGVADGALAVDRDGIVYAAHAAAGSIVRIPVDGAPETFRAGVGRISCLAMRPDGTLLASQPAWAQIVALYPDGRQETLAEEIEAAGLAVLENGTILASDAIRGEIVAIDAAGRRRTVWNGEGLGAPAQMALSPDQAFLAVLDRASHWAWSFQIMPDGALGNGQPFFRIDGGEEFIPSTVQGIAVDTTGELYVPTPLGITVLTASGRSRQFINPPVAGTVTAVAFGGPERDWLHATMNGTLYRRRIRRQGAVPWARITPPAPHL